MFLGARRISTLDHKVVEKDQRSNAQSQPVVMANAAPNVHVQTTSPAKRTQSTTDLSGPESETSHPDVFDPSKYGCEVGGAIQTPVKPVGQPVVSDLAASCSSKRKHEEAKQKDASSSRKAEKKSKTTKQVNNFYAGLKVSYAKYTRREGKRCVL